MQRGPGLKKVGGGGGRDTDTFFFLRLHYGVGVPVPSAYTRLTSRPDEKQKKKKKAEGGGGGAADSSPPPPDPPLWILTITPRVQICSPQQFTFQALVLMTKFSLFSPSERTNLILTLVVYSQATSMMLSPCLVYHFK